MKTVSREPETLMKSAESDLHIVFEKIWASERGRREIYRADESGVPNISVDWAELQRMARRRTPFEKLRRVILNFSDRAWVYFLSVAIIGVVVVVCLLQQWSLREFRTATTSEQLFIGCALLAAYGALVLILASIMQLYVGRSLPAPSPLHLVVSWIVPFSGAVAAAVACLFFVLPSPYVPVANPKQISTNLARESASPEAVPSSENPLLARESASPKAVPSPENLKQENLKNLAYQDEPANPSSPPNQFYVAGIFEKVIYNRNARSVLREKLRFHPTDPEILNALGVAGERAGDLVNSRVLFVLAFASAQRLNAAGTIPVIQYNMRSAAISTAVTYLQRDGQVKVYTVGNRTRVVPVEISTKSADNIMNGVIAEGQGHLEEAVRLYAEACKVDKQDKDQLSPAAVAGAFDLQAVAQDKPDLFLRLEPALVK